MNDTKALSEADFEAVSRIVFTYVMSDLEEEGRFEDITDVEKDKLMDVVNRSVTTSIEVMEYLARFEIDKIRKVDTLNMNEDFELAHKLLFET